MYPEKLTHANFHLFVLDDHCPWKEGDLGRGNIVERMELPCAPVHDYWLSQPSSSVYELKFKLPVEPIIELAIMAKWQTSFNRFYHICDKHREEIITTGAPAYVYYKHVQRSFLTITADPFSHGRLNPSSVNFPKIFLSNKGKPNGRLRRMTIDVYYLLEWINEMAGAAEFNHANILEDRVRYTLSQWKDFRCDLGEFRLMMVLQVCILTAIVVRPNKDLNNLVYPVSNLRAAKQLELEDVDCDRCGEVTTRIHNKIPTLPAGKNMEESVLCETPTD